MKVYALLVCIFVAVGSTLKVDLVWSLSDTFNGLMVIPNLISLLSLSNTVSRLYQAYRRAKVKFRRRPEMGVVVHTLPPVYDQSSLVLSSAQCPLQNLGNTVSTIPIRKTVSGAFFRPFFKSPTTK